MSKYPEIDAVLAGESEGCIICADCLEVMAEMPDGCVDAVVTDPPYGIGEANRNHESRSKLCAAGGYGRSNWDNSPPPPVAFDEMRRLSTEQVVWGGNHLASWLGSSPSWIVWDKDNGTNDFADCELAWTSHKRAVRKVRWRWNGMLQEPGAPRDARQHPTQKPVGLMIWVLEEYTSEGDIILDPYLGVGTTCVAAKKLGRRWIGIEISEEYAAIARRRVQNTERSLFTPETPETPKQNKQANLFEDPIK